MLSSPHIIKTVLVDDHQIITDSLAILLERIDGIEVVETFNDSRKVIDALGVLQPDIVITDYHMPYIDGINLTGKIKSSFPDMYVIVLSVNEDPKDIKQAYQAGASGYLLKKIGKEELSTAIREIYGGKLYYNQEVLKAILSEESKKRDTFIIKPNEVLARLTPRETEIVKLLVKEYSSQEIATMLHISTGTVETHRHNILRKLDVKSTIGVVKFAIEAGIV